jgi:signal transduction histidine kinase
VITAVIVCFSIAICVVLVASTTYLHRTTSEMATSVEGVRQTQAAEIRLLLHMRAPDPVVRSRLGAELRRRVDDATAFVSTTAEAEALDAAHASIADYLAAPDEPALQAAAVARLQDVIDINVAQAHEAVARAGRVDSTANVFAIGATVLALVLAGGLLVWSRRNVYVPLLSLARAMERYGRGEREVRSAAGGPHELQDMQARFNEMADALASQRRAQMAFLGAVAHDLRNPLTPLRLTFEQLSPTSPLPDEERLRTMVSRLGRHLTRLERMIGDLVDAAKVEAGELELRPRVIDVREVVHAVADLFEPSISEHPIAVAVPDAPVPLHCDPLRIEQVVINLVSNAIKYSPRGAEVGIELTAAAGEVTIAVRDHGIGIDDDHRATLFEAFRRLGDGATQVPGTGLGLYGARRLIELHGGRIDVDSAPGKGSVFRVQIPSRLPASAPQRRDDGA